MKAMVLTQYGSPDFFELREVAKPVPGDDEVLVSVHAASINSWDWEMLMGTPFVNRVMAGLFKPIKIPVMGCDIAGTVDSVGKSVTQFHPGDEVYGDLSGCGFGGFAEYVCARADALVLKPGSMSYEQAAAIPQAALLALQGLRDKGHIQPGQKVLINGAGGGAGSFALQIAKAYGAEVTGVDNAEKLAAMHAMGADHVIDYSKDDYTKSGQTYDLIVEFALHRSALDCLRTLTPKGNCVVAGGATSRILQTVLVGAWLSLTGTKKMGLLLHKANEGLEDIKTLFEAGKVVPVIDRRYPLTEIADAFRYFGAGHARGKIVINRVA